MTFTISPAEFDALHHDRLAVQIASYIASMPLGSVIAIQGPWGSGKTDVLARVGATLSNQSGHTEPVGINPWKYGKADLITPVVMELVVRVTRAKPGDQDKGKAFRKLAETVVRAGTAMAFKAVTVFAPFGEVLGAGQGAVDEYVKGLFNKPDGTPRDVEDLDPVAEIARRFSALVGEYAALVSAKGRLVVCVDDLDRCLPDQQIAMLEAIHFLTAAQAACSFIVAIDPTLVRQAAETHYGTTRFDSHRYLDKLFDLRLNLPSLRADDIRPLFAELLARNVTEEGMMSAFGTSRDNIADALAHVFVWPELTNPRLIVRTVKRLQLLADALVEADDVDLQDRPTLIPLCVWIAIAERWPQLREILQATDAVNWENNVVLIAYHSGVTSVAETEDERDDLDAALKSAANVLARLPSPDQSPDLGPFLTHPIDGQINVLSMIADLERCDAVCRRYGL